MPVLDKELQKYYEDYFDLFSRPGWKMFEEELGETLQNLRDKMETTTEPQTVQGQIKEVRFMLNFREQLNNAYETLTSPVVEEDK